MFPVSLEQSLPSWSRCSQRSVRLSAGRSASPAACCGLTRPASCDTSGSWAPASSPSDSSATSATKPTTSSKLWTERAMASTPVTSPTRPGQGAAPSWSQVSRLGHVGTLTGTCFQSVQTWLGLVCNDGTKTWTPLKWPEASFRLEATQTRLELSLTCVCHIQDSAWLNLLETRFKLFLNDSRHN